jgi:tol-pal system protein YbgF
MLNKKWISWGLILTSCVLLFGCASGDDVRILDRELRRVQSQLYTLQKDQETMKQEMALSGSAGRDLQKEVSALKTDTQRLQSNLSDVLLRVENLQSEQKILSSGFEEYKEFSKRPAKEIDRVREDTSVRLRMLEEREKALEAKNKAMEDRARQLEKQMEENLKAMEGKIDRVATKQAELEKVAAAAEAERSAAAKAQPPPVETKGPSSTTGAGDLYRDAYETFQKGDLEGARRKFEAFLKQYPNTDLSDNAQFWIGETWYVEEKYERAIVEYEKVVKDYPSGDKVPYALLKQGMAFQKLGDKASARIVYNQIVKKYPNSNQARVAKAKLTELKK